MNDNDNTTEEVSRRLREVLEKIPAIHKMELSEDQKFSMLYYALYEDGLSVEEAMKEAKAQGYPFVVEDEDVYFVRRFVVMLFMADMQIKEMVSELQKYAAMVLN